MAKKSVIARQNKREKIVNKYASKRLELNSIMRDPRVSEQDKWEARTKIQLLPRDSSPVRLQNRCKITGRSRSVYSRIGLCRNKFREFAMNGEIPGLTKASW